MPSLLWIDVGTSARKATLRTNHSSS